jgi:PKD repeat protein
MKALLRPSFVGGLSIAIALSTLLGSSSGAFAATPPSITTLSISTPVYQGDKPTVTATFTDPDLADHHTVDIDWGDFTFDSYPLLLGARSFSVQKSTPYMNRSPFVVQVTLSDPISSTTRFLNITVLNAPPSITSFGLSTSAPAAGQPVTATGAFTDPGAADTHNVTLDWGDGSLTTTMNLAAAVYSFTSGAHTYTAAGNYTVSATVTDSAGASAIATSTVSVHAPNQPPSVVSFGVTAGPEGGSSSLALTFADPDAADTHNVSIAWGDGLTSGPTLLAAGVTSYSTTHVYADTGTYQVVLTLVDSAGHSVTATASVSPTNVAPVITSLTLSPSSVVDHQMLTLSGTFTDPGTADSFTLTVDWGGGSTASIQGLAAGTRTFSASHEYLAAGGYVVTAKVTDRDGAAGTQTVSLVVLARTASVSELLDQMSGLVVSFELDRHMKRWLLERVEELRESYSTADTEFCDDLKELGKLSAFASRRLSADQSAALSALVTKLENAAQCPAASADPTDPEEKTDRSAEAHKSDNVKHTKSDRDHAERSEGRD